MCPSSNVPTNKCVICVPIIPYSMNVFKLQICMSTLLMCCKNKMFPLGCDLGDFCLSF